MGAGFKLAHLRHLLLRLIPPVSGMWALSQPKGARALALAKAFSIWRLNGRLKMFPFVLVPVNFTNSIRATKILPEFPLTSSRGTTCGAENLAGAAIGVPARKSL